MRSNRFVAIMVVVGMMMGSIPVLVSDVQAAGPIYPTITVGSNPYGICYNPANGYVYVTNGAASTVSVINGATNTVVGSPIAV